MSSQHSQRLRGFRPDPAEYDAAKAALDARGWHMGEFLRSCLRWLNADPSGALATLHPTRPDPRPMGRPSPVQQDPPVDPDGDGS
jgi:hypothetical protein